MVLIRYNHSVLQNKSVSAATNQCDFSSLTAGRLYTVTVETWSGELSSSVSTDGRTCEREGGEGEGGRNRERERGAGGEKQITCSICFCL